MTTAVSADISLDVLAAESKDSDRFVYSNYFVPLLLTFDDDKTPIVPFFVKQRILEHVRYGSLDGDRLNEILQQLDFPELWAKNEMREANAALDAAAGAPRNNGGNGSGGLEAPVVGRAEAVRAEAAHAEEGSLEGVAGAIRGTDSLLDTLDERLDEPGREVLHAASALLARSARTLEEHASHSHGNGGSRSILELEPPTVLSGEDVELVAGLLQSTIGYGFLDRTRITPAGFEVGEHVYALGLTAGEEVVVEQKTFTKRQATFEDQTEQERQLDIELSSTYSTELQEGYDRQKSLSDTWGLNASHTGSYSSPISPYGQWNGNHTIAYSKNVTQSNQEARRRSVKDGQTASSKVSAKYRTQHKMLFRVTTESGFEVSSKRTIVNPNRTTPITLHHFKILQRLRLRQERYGVRLCWAPSVEDPALRFFDNIREGRQRIIDDAMAKIPQRPSEPLPASTGSTQREQKVFPSETREADIHNFVNGQRSDYDVDVSIDAGWSYDGDVRNVHIEDTSQRTAGTYTITRVGIPVFVDGDLRVRVHVEAGDRTGAQPISFQVLVTCFKDVTLPGNAAQDPVYQAALEDWRTQVASWDADRDAAIAAANEAADAFEQRMRAQLNPVNEMISQIVKRDFRPAVRDDEWEIEYWQRLFDWERASVATFPSWWSGSPLRDPLSDPADFINASWAKLYLPVRLGMERAALRWIHGKKVAEKLPAPIEARFDDVVSDLRKFREQELGAADEIAELESPCQKIQESYRCMAEWTELMPTDGTHVEVVQGITTAADDITKAQLDAAQKLRAAQADSEEGTVSLKKKAADQMSEPADIRVRVGDDEHDPPGGGARA